MRTSLRLVSVAVLSGLVLYKLGSFQKSVQENYLQFMAAGRAAGLLLDDDNGEATTRQGACRLLPSSHASALSLWTKHLADIHSASQLLPMDKDYEFSDLTAQLLHLISPRLPNSVKAIPRDWTSIMHVLEDVLLPRWKFILRQSTTPKIEPRPVKIVIMGGSVVAGINCLQVFGKKVKHKLSREQCAWPYRLQQFLDRMTMAMVTQAGGVSLPPRLLEVHTVVMGGSNTLSGNAILEFDLLPPEAKNPDIIINAYATNDMHLSTFQQGDLQGSWREKTLVVLQDFVRLAHTTSGQCTAQERQYPPVVLHLDDYLGNEQREIVTTTELSQAVHILSTYYGKLTAMSYADIVRDWVYGDTHEFWFSPFEWYPPYKLDKRKMKREIHPSMPMHTVVPWLLSYGMLHLFVHYCDRQAYFHDNLQEPTPLEELPKAKKIYDDEYDWARNQRGLPLPALKGDIRLPGKPHVTPYGLPPPLTPDLSLQDVSGLWRNRSLAEAAEKKSCSTSVEPKCPFAWVSGLLSGHNALDETQVEDYFRQHSLEYQNQGWQVKRHVDGKKMGFVPAEEQPGAKLTLVWDASKTAPLRRVVVFYLKSYGEKWDQSRLELQLYKNNNKLLSQELEGFHAKDTSEMYIERMTLPQTIQDTDQLRLEATFVRGKAFKIMGLLVCR